MLQEIHSVSPVGLLQSRRRDRQECFDTQTSANEVPGEWTDSHCWARIDQSLFLAAPTQVCHGHVLRGRYLVCRFHLLRLDLFHVHDLDHLLCALPLVLWDVQQVVASLPSQVSTFRVILQPAVQK